MIIKSLLFALCLAAAVGGIFWAGKSARGNNAISAYLPGIASVQQGLPEREPFTESDFRRIFEESVNADRGQEGYLPLKHDARLEQWLRSSGSAISCKNLKTVLAQAKLPDFAAIRASGATGDSLRGILKGFLEKMSSPASAGDDGYAMLIRELPGAQHEVILVTGETRPELTLTTLGDTSTGSFVSQCAHCSRRSAYQNERSSSTLIFTCPGCGLCSRLLGRDTKGRYHDAPAFLIPSAGPAVPPGTHPLDAMILIWQEAVRRCHYVEDSPGDESPADFWQTPRQTLQKGTGDCEDSALLVTDWMLGNGIPARMALGTMAGGGHAWCIVRVDRTDFLLESTNRNPDLDNLPVVNPDDGYVPSALFDRDALYVRAQPSKPFDGDYWSEEKWIRLPHKKAAGAQNSTAPKAKTASAP